MNATRQVRLQGTGSEVDAIEDIRLRTWARKNYVSSSERDETWHPVILDEMKRMDYEPQKAGVV